MGIDQPRHQRPTVTVYDHHVGRLSYFLCGNLADQIARDQDVPRNEPDTDAIENIDVREEGLCWRSLLIFRLCWS